MLTKGAERTAARNAIVATFAKRRSENIRSDKLEIFYVLFFVKLSCTLHQLFMGNSLSDPKDLLITFIWTDRNAQNLYESRQIFNRTHCPPRW
jgi:hypothetical protein